MTWAGLAVVQLDTPTLVAVVAAFVASGASLFRWRSGERGNVLAQTATELSTAAGQTVHNLMADNARLRSENLELLRKLENFEERVVRLTQEISQLRNELGAARRAHAPDPPNGSA